MAYFWYRRTGSTVWTGAQADQRDKVLLEIRPEYVTVLDASESPQGDWKREDYLKMKYSGPLYFDWDSNDLNEAVQDFKSTLVRLDDELSLDLHSCRLFATGGRGFHLEIPQACFIAKPPKGGMLNLPHIYREVALRLVTDSLDMKVYSAKSGRMWRCPNVNRNAEHPEKPPSYKVPITVQQALDMTPELYAELTSEPRLGPETSPANLCLALNNMFMEAKDSVDKAMSRAAKVKDESGALKRFKGEPPKSLQRLMSGEHLNPEQGFNNIALQLAITAHALGLTEAQFIERTEGLVQSYSGDGSRYNSPGRRRDALRDRYYYIESCPAYVFSYGGLRSICADGFEPTELAPTDDILAGDDGMAPDTVEDSEPETPEQEAALKLAESTLAEGVRITPSGILRKTSDGIFKLSDLILTKPAALISIESGSVVGVEVDVALAGRGRVIKKGRRVIPMDIFTSRQSLDKFASSVGGVFKGTDIQATIVRNILNNTAIAKKRCTYGVTYEGLSLIQNPNTEGESDLIPVWMGSGDRPIITRRSIHPDVRASYGDDLQYDYENDPASSDLMHQPKLGSKSSFQSDLADAPELTGGLEFEAWFGHLLEMNEPVVIAQMLGWFVGCFHRAFYDKMASGQFPILSVSGPAGTGKSTTTKLLLNLHYSQAKQEKSIIYCNIATPYAVKAAMEGSYSIPLLLDEFKPSVMPEYNRRVLIANLHASYDGQGGATGGAKDGSALSSHRDIMTYKLKTPVCLIGETMEDSAAIMQRSVQVGFKQGAWSGREHHEAEVKTEQGLGFMSSLGCSLLLASMVMRPADFQARYKKCCARAALSAIGNINPRQINNLAVLMASLQFLKDVLVMRGVTAFNERLDALVEQLYDSRLETTQRSVMSEEARILNDISALSRLDPESPLYIKENVHYLVGADFVELNMREVFVRYQQWCRATGNSPFYKNDVSFIVAMSKVQSLLDKTCVRSPLKKSAATHVYRFNSHKLLSEGVEPFKSYVLAN